MTAPAIWMSIRLNRIVCGKIVSFELSFGVSGFPSNLRVFP